MNIEDFDYELPEELIAQKPLNRRDDSRLLVLHRDTQHIEHKYFPNIKEYLQPGDCLVLNDTRVMPARLYGVKEDTGAKLEVLLLHEQEEDVWEVLAKPAKKIKEGTIISFGEDKIRAECTGIQEHGGRILRVTYSGDFHDRLDELGEMPLPPYIKEELPERERYQTVYSSEQGSAAAPTAGLHFTYELLEEIKAMGVSIAFITLHVGLGTFKPVTEDNVEDHDMHAEFYRMSQETANHLKTVKSNGGRIISVGTTSTRTLETIIRDNGEFTEASGWTDIFIYPPFEFKAIDGLITNFHLPKSTLIMMISAFAGRKTILQTYQNAVEHRYRFFSFGDAMLIL